MPAVVRYGEIGLKSDRVRRRMERQLMKNIRKRAGGYVKKLASRIILYEGDEEKLSKVFGVVSWSPALEVRADIEEIKEAALELYTGGTFRVRARRVTKDFPLTSPEINRVVGAFIVEKRGASVDLNNPRIEIGIEIIGRRAFVFTRTVKGPGGLPVGVEGDAVLLFSGGIDSPVAGWLIGKRGVRIFPFHIRSGVNIYSVLKILSTWFPDDLPLKEVDFPREKILKVLERRNKKSYFHMVFKAVLYRLASEYAEEIGAEFLVTGESIGQVASQTLHNLSVLSRLSPLPVLRPLAGLDKEEVVKLARHIGTYEVSSRLPEPCATIKIKPVTYANEQILRELVEEVMG